MNVEAAALLESLYKMEPKVEVIDDVAHFFAGGLYIRRSIIQPGGIVKMHVHEYDHLSIALGVGVFVTEDGAINVMPGDCLEVKAGKRHSFVAKTTTIWFCIHPTSEAEAQELYGKELVH